MLKEIIATCLLSLATGTTTLKTKQPNRAVDSQRIYGAYNLRQGIDTTLTENMSQIESRITGLELDPNFEKLNPIWYNNDMYYIYDMELYYYPAANEFAESIDFSANIYKTDQSDSTYIHVEIFADETLDDKTQEWRELVFYMRTPLFLEGQKVDLWNALITTDDNNYTMTYTGYYSFNPTLASVDYRFCLLGTINLGTKMQYALWGQKTNASSNNTGTIYYNYYDAQNDEYAISTYTLPLSYSKISNQWYLTGVKMPMRTYNDFSGYGVFAYVPQTAPDSYSFEDLFFSLADTPIYFVYSLFNWQLFGANLFIAFVGLVSFALVLILFRKVM